jgi:uncharacterized membrane protein YqjE
MNSRVATEPVQHSTTGNHERSLRAIIAEIADEIREFLETRLNMLKSEVRETLGAAKVALPLALVAAGLFATGLLMLTVAIVALVAAAFAGNPYAWFYAFLIVGFCWIVFGSVAVFFAVNEFRGRGRFPRRTLQILKADKIWLQQEARGRL